MSDSNAKPAAAKNGGYEADQIQNLHPRDQVRLRPSSYVGGTGNSALAHLVDELLANSADEALAGYCKNVWVTIGKDQAVTVADDGRGVPIGETKLALSGKVVPTPQAAFTEMFTGGKYDESAYSSSGGMNGMGSKAIVYLSRQTTIDIRRDAQRYRQVFKNGPLNTPKDVFTVEPPKIEKYTGKDTGTSVSFLYDDSVFDSDVHLDGERIGRKCYNLSRLVPGLSIFFSDERTGEKETYLSEHGISDLVSDLNEGESPLFRDIIRLDVEKIVEDANKKPIKIGVDVAFQPAATETGEERGTAFTNLIHQPDGGTHVTGFRKGLTRALNDHFRKVGLLKPADVGFEGSDVGSGLAFTISLRTNVAALQFESQTKKQLNSSWVDSALAQIIDDAALVWLTDHPAQGKIWYTYITEVRKNRERMLAERRSVKAKIGGSGLDPLISKLKRETVRDPSKTEIYFVEGDSAGGSAEGARDRTFQAVLPFRGKMLNLQNADRKKSLENEDVRRMATALETGVGVYFDYERLRYKRIVLMADADADGGHITMLWLAAIWNMFPDILRKGHVYVAMPPLFSVYDHKTKSRVYFYDNPELATWARGRTKESFTATRFKGLGEMSADDLRETAMSPHTRRLRQIEVADIGELKILVDELMGKSAEKRRAFMDEHARGATTREDVDTSRIGA